MAWLDFAELFAFCDLHASRVPARRTLERPMYFDRQGFAIPGAMGLGGGDWENSATRRWAELHASDDYKRVAQDDVPNDSFLSTVWLGLDHGFVGPPLFFETMRFAKAISTNHIPASEHVPAHTMQYHESLEFPDIFAEDPDAMTDQLRYGSEEEALAAHHEIVRRLRIREGH
jgi:hypothetical protein